MTPPPVCVFLFVNFVHQSNLIAQEIIDYCIKQADSIFDILTLTVFQPPSLPLPRLPQNNPHALCLFKRVRISSWIGPPLPHHQFLCRISHSTSIQYWGTLKAPNYPTLCSLLSTSMLEPLPFWDTLLVWVLNTLYL